MIENSYVNGYFIKSVKVTDEDNGDCIVELEASNENFDLDDEQVLQKALRDSKDFFLSNGVISDNHLHLKVDKKGNAITDNSKIIGEPLDVYVKGKSTFVKCRLYKNVEAAQDYINLLRNGSTRIKGSVGGIMPRVRKNKDGSKTITAFKWNDLALTCSPVNYTVGSARLVKSYTVADFCKALTAGSGTNATDFEGGRAFQKENVEGEIADEESVAVQSLLEAVSDDKVQSEEEAISFLTEKKGFSKEEARACVREIISQGSEDMAKMTILDKVRKSLAGGKKNASTKDFFKKSNDGDEDEELNLDEDDLANDDGGDDDDDEEGDDEEGDDEEGAEPMKKGGEDVTALLGELMSKVDAISARLDASDKRYAKVEKSLIDVASEVVKIGDTPLVKKSMVSSVYTTEGNNGKKSDSDMISTSFSKDDWKVAKSILIKAAKAQALPIEKSEHLSVVCQKALTNGGVMMRGDYRTLQDLYKKYNVE